MTEKRTTLKTISLSDKDCANLTEALIILNNLRWKLHSQDAVGIGQTEYSASLIYACVSLIRNMINYQKNGIIIIENEEE